jgi:hypothetical protein
MVGIIVHGIMYVSLARKGSESKCMGWVFMLWIHFLDYQSCVGWWICVLGVFKTWVLWYRQCCCCSMSTDYMHCTVLGLLISGWYYIHEQMLCCHIYKCIPFVITPKHFTGKAFQNGEIRIWQMCINVSRMW